MHVDCEYSKSYAEQNRTEAHHPARSYPSCISTPVFSNLQDISYPRGSLKTGNDHKLTQRFWVAQLWGWIKDFQSPLSFRFLSPAVNRQEFPVFETVVRIIECSAHKHNKEQNKRTYKQEPLAT